ncbi:hypothetical protein niasHT_020611 [Heterodera trifolii]|uniref:Calcineurin-like phosphoesterase domain-containing protein n=1 Tax=Heterodera trifolii TaxID=157864 RepID=A0ABD2KFQ7_9BILA
MVLRRHRPFFRSFVPLLICLLPCLVVELFSFWAASFLWQIPPISNPNSVVILIISDPQLIGHINEPGWTGIVSRWDSDSRAVRPDLEVFLGDLFDEGVLLGGDERQFVDTRERFMKIFPLSKCSTNRIYLPGDNDIGGEMEPVYAELYERFKRHFPPHFTNSSDNFKRFITIYESDVFNFGAANRICCDHSAGTNTVRLLLSHFPILAHATAKTEQQLWPINVVLSAHDHTTGIYMQWRHSQQRQRNAASAAVLPDHIADVQWKWTVSMFAPHTLPLIEFKSPTVSYRMGVPKMGYGLLVVTPFITNGTALVQFSVLWLPSRLLQLRMFLCLAVLGLLCTVLSLCGCFRRCEIRMKHLLANYKLCRR